MTMKTILFANQKGGVTKSTTCANVSTCISSMRKKTLMIDLDPQGNLSDIFGVNTDDRVTAYEVLRLEDPIREGIVAAKDFCEIPDSVVAENLYILPADIALAGLEAELQTAGKEYRLREVLEEVKDEFDFCLIDCPPSLGLFVSMALTAGDFAVVPALPSKSSLKGFKQLSNTIRTIQRYTNPDLKIAGILFTRFDARQNNSKETLEVGTMLASMLQSKVFTTKIRNSVVVEDAHNCKLPVVLYNIKSNPAKDYIEFTKELLKGMNN